MDNGTNNSRESRCCAADQILPSHGGYRQLRSFQVAELVYDLTSIFCDRFIDKRSRTHDQMVQAARSGVQNIAEGSVASGTSKRTEIKLTNVARASLEELLRDYEDFLRQHSLRLWSKDSPEALSVRRGCLTSVSGVAGMKVASAETAANSNICLIHQASYLLGRQLRKLEADFLEHGGVTERMYAARVARRNQTACSADRSDSSDASDRSDSSDKSEPVPGCPRCGKPMRRRQARRGAFAGQMFWGCTGYPECTGIQPIA
jgi:restriction system protein